MPGMKSHVWQTLTGILFSAILTGSGCWLLFGSDAVTRNEMTNYVQSQSPWVRERGEISAGIKSNQTSISKIETAVDRLITSQQELIVEQRVLITKVDELLDDQ